VDIILDEGAPLAAAYGTSREDTASACGDADNGFGLLFNWNTLGDGVHTLRALADDVQFASAAFTVTTLWGAEFLPGVSGSYWVEGFPYPFTDVLIHWEESSQNFVIERILPNGNGPNVGGVGFSHEESLPNF
jgi:hypothetical protein